MMSIAEQKAKINSDIQALRKKIQLSEGESKAFYEESEGEKQANKAAITTLRGEIKHLHVKIEEAKQGSERSVERVLQQRRRAISAPVKVKKAEGAIRASEYKLHDLVKRLNFLQHSRKQRENRLNSLKQQLGESSSDRVQEEHRTIQQLQQDLIALENEQERVGVSVTEAESVKRRYGAMVTALKGEAASYRTTLDTLHARLAEEKDSLKNLRDSRKKAEKTRDCLRTRLHEEEESAYETKREREKRLFEFRKKAEERRQQDLGAAVDRRLSIMRTPTRRDSPTAALTQDTQEQIEAELEKYQQLFSRLKEVLGVTSVEEVLDRLTSQAGTREHLRQLRSVTLEEVTRLKQEKEQLHEELHRVKYASTEDAAKMVGMIEDLKKKVEEKEAMKEDLSGRLDGTLKILAGVRAGQEHIAEKLETAENERPPKAESPLQYLVVLMAFCMDRARELMEEVRDAQIDQKLAEMVEEEKDSGGMMTSPENIRVAFPAAGATAKAAQQQVEEGGDSGEEEETLTRKFIKRQAQMIVEAKARKRNRPVTSFKS
ncbi:outer dynein arm-docking complex subunit 3-like [Penaeus chinensis]|uniref:outer dynein arm-docking complex subunit 3-like n=1 Tax=Penaeus chinensis TaxID=139456 RepID=UPI001FB75ABF|nr:outer dynein arm-docking complex subunit 3-like [Penaeus chinensis]XP_047496289.1 outer dynein arm-docking complex subunit 3-like [Penaeus chinensis]